MNSTSHTHAGCHPRAARNEPYCGPDCETYRSLGEEALSGNTQLMRVRTRTRTHTQVQLQLDVVLIIIMINNKGWH